MALEIVSPKLIKDETRGIFISCIAFCDPSIFCDQFKVSSPRIFVTLTNAFNPTSIRATTAIFFAIEDVALFHSAVSFLAVFVAAVSIFLPPSMTIDSAFLISVCNCSTLASMPTDIFPTSVII